jgi:maltose O-acetyltransferase
MTEKDKMLAGEMYRPMDPQLVEERLRARLLFQKINAIDDSRKEERDELFYELIGPAGKDLWIEPPFYCDYGYNITLGHTVFINFNCCILDVAEVRIGDHTMMGPNVQIYTATHPLEAKARNSGREYAKPISIGNNVWIGGHAVICPGVTIGNNVVIGAGTVVTKNFPDDVFIAGNPAKIIRQIDNS